VGQWVTQSMAARTRRHTRSPETVPVTIVLRVLTERLQRKLHYFDFSGLVGQQQVVRQAV